MAQAEMIERTLEVDRKQRFRPGVAVFIANEEGRVAFGRRKTGKWDDGMWCLPGGGLDWGETIGFASEREPLEECGIVGTCVGQLCTHTYMNEEADSYHLTVYTVLDADAGQSLTLCEPDKFYEWGWFDPAYLPTPLAFPDTAKAAIRFSEYMSGMPNVLVQSLD